MKLTIEAKRVGAEDNRWWYFIYDHLDEQVRCGGWYKTELAAFRVGTDVARDEARRQIEEIKEVGV